MQYEYVTLTNLGKQYGVSSHKIGKWLKALGLRTDAGQPSSKAFAGNWVEKWESTNPGCYFWAWNQAKVTELLDQMAYPRAT